MKYVFAGRSGLENTAFALLSPEGKKLTKGGRTPGMVFGSPERLVEALNSTFEGYAAKAESIRSLPVHRDLRLALNVAAADMRPLVVVRGESAQAAGRLAKSVAQHAWLPELVGTCHFVVLEEEQTVAGLAPALGVTVVQPDPYGLGGEALAHAGPATKKPVLLETLREGLSAFEVAARGHADHIREARRRGIEWRGVLETTDADERKSDRKQKGRGGK